MSQKCRKMVSIVSRVGGLPSASQLCRNVVSTVSRVGRLPGVSQKCRKMVSTVFRAGGLPGANQKCRVQRHVRDGRVYVCFSGPPLISFQETRSCLEDFQEDRDFQRSFVSLLRPCEVDFFKCDGLPGVPCCRSAGVGFGPQSKISMDGREALPPAG